LTEDPAFRGAGIRHVLGLRPPGVPTDATDPKVMNALMGEFDSLTHQYFNKTGGNLQQAQQLAIADLKGPWGISEVNGKRELMKYAPEHMVPGLTAEMIRDDLRVHGHPDAHLTEDPQYTARSGGTVWQLTEPDQFGMYEPVRNDKNQPQLYTLPDVKEAQLREAVGQSAE